ncbi:14-3-3 like protein [Cucumispora dikerogammari]|nr:14-3-3 like protein [Cucumispora dikerogammari]
MDDFFFSLKKLRLACRTESPKMLPFLIESIEHLNTIRSEFALAAQHDTPPVRYLSFPDIQLMKKFRSYFQSVFQRLISKPRMTFVTLNGEKQNISTEVTDPKTLDFLDNWLQSCKNEVIELTTQANKLIDEQILNEPTFFGDIESQAFFYKMKADYYRYVLEVTDKSVEASQLSKDYYLKAWSLALQLTPTNSVRLGVALNYSVLLFEDLDEKTEAIKLANDAFYEGLKNSEHIEHEDFKESTLLMQLLRDNMTMWGGGDNLR